MKILKFGAIWCTECLVMRPMWEEIEKNHPSLVTEYYDADENPEVLEKYGVKELPTCLFVDDSGEVIERLKGTQNKEDLIGKVEGYIS